MPVVMPKMPMFSKCKLAVNRSKQPAYLELNFTYQCERLTHRHNYLHFGVLDEHYE